MTESEVGLELAARRSLKTASSSEDFAAVIHVGKRLAPVLRAWRERMAETTTLPLENDLLCAHPFRGWGINE